MWPVYPVGGCRTDNRGNSAQRRSKSAQQTTMRLGPRTAPATRALRGGFCVLSATQAQRLLSIMLVRSWGAPEVRRKDLFGVRGTLCRILGAYHSAPEGASWRPFWAANAAKSHMPPGEGFRMPVHGCKHQMDNYYAERGYRRQTVRKQAAERCVAQQCRPCWCGYQVGR